MPCPACGLEHDPAQPCGRRARSPLVPRTRRSIHGRCSQASVVVVSAWWMAAADETVVAGAWEYGRDDAEGLRVAAVVAMDLLTKPDFELAVMASRGDHVTAQVTAGALTDPDAVLYVERRGLFEVARRERWSRRTVFVLRAWPSR